MFWSGHLRCRKTASLSDISSALFVRVIKLFRSLPARGELEEPVFPLLGKDPFNWTG